MNTPQIATATAPAPRLSPSDIEIASPTNLRAELRESYRDTDTARLAFQDVSAKLVEALRALAAANERADCYLAVIEGAEYRLPEDFAQKGKVFARLIGATAAEQTKAIIAERDAARADAAAAIALLQRFYDEASAITASGFPANSDAETVAWSVGCPLQLQLEEFLYPDESKPNPGASLLNVRDAAVAFCRVAVGGDDVAEVAALRAAIAALQEAK